jgi:NAD(P)-dependent dehydrogenase (short-subunit alcohol dehydrogenase family)
VNRQEPEQGSVLVTGASRGLGYELCRLYWRAGWTVFPLIRSIDDVSYHRSPVDGRYRPIVADLEQDSSVDAIEDVVSSTGRLDLLINNAGIPGSAAQLELVTTSELRQLFDVHCLAVVRCTQAALPALKASAQPVVVNVTSRLGSISRNSAGEFDADAPSYSYRIAKSAQNMLTVCLARELAQRGITICAIHPGEFRSQLNPDAAVSAGQAAHRVAQRISGLRHQDHGKWFDLDGKVLPW